MAKYQMQEMNDLHGTGERKLYPRMKIDWVANLDRLAEQISRRSSFTGADVKGVVTALGDLVAEHLGNGWGVWIDGFGYFTPSLGLREGFDPETVDGESKRNAMSIEVRGVRFRPDKELVSKVIDHCHLERGETIRIRSQKFTPEQRRAMAIDYLETNSHLPIRSYMAMTGLSRTTATNELRKWYEQGFIGAEGAHSHRRYIKRAQQ